jgi:serine phosphatase RsbU (regulator of sigma subunit)
VTTVAAPGGSHASDPGDRPTSAAAHRGQGISPVRATVIVVLVGLLITVAVAWTAWTINRHNEHRLLQVQTRQASAVVSASILSLGAPLGTALELEDATGGSAQEFDQFASTLVGPNGPFVSAVLWRLDGTNWQPVAVVGASPLMTPHSQQAVSFIGKSSTSPTFVVTPVPTQDPRRVGYAIANPNSPTIAIYAERAIPANRVVPFEKGSAFSDLNFATYLGRTTSLSALATTDLPLAQLPIRGNVVRSSIPFGDSSVTLVTAPRGPLGGALGGALPWIFLVGGVVLTLGAAVLTYQLVRRRRRAERDAQTIATLYEQLDGLYDEQRSIAETLQRALLPQRNPSIPNLEIASRYLPGTDGVEIGGDWFSLIEVDERHFAFAVGDVSGKGVGAASIMARLRFTIRAYLMEGHPPDVVLGMCSRQLNVNRDGHLSTVLIGVGDIESGLITLANAGHLNPLRVADDSAEFIPTEVGLPLGVEPGSYSVTTVQLTSGSAFVAFTDGLVERRGESLDLGLGRLVQAVTGGISSVDDLLSRLLGTLGPAGSDDDVAMLAFRWTSPVAESAPQGARLDRVR